MIKVAILAGGCFWGLEYHLKKIYGVLSVKSGYMGGITENPSYEQVKSKTSGHAEVVKIEYDDSIVNYELIVRIFFEIHDPTQSDGQGIDIGPQYRSEIFYLDEEQKNIAEKLINILKEKGYGVVTKLTPASIFYLAEDYHQDYFENNGGEPDCHFYVKRF